ncbi:DUF4179 domain-containing protein [Paenibacillus sp. N3/727]|uniref:DUF4179 domain-containing protein n=1 Tax=Paenibacillus sp. N3/727 TaxID=2925845 RepID=UPI001F53491A|nr:DUF4179 domain-containing protein [Paenibacillus sp. N3/727]UNK16281.1 DUF4179 domain-containing protein [Paenibacillus sp. N3/727]
MTRTTSKRKPNLIKRTIMVASATAVLGAAVIGTGFISPAMADSLKKVPMFGTLYEGTSEKTVQAAIQQGIVSEPNLSVTHDGITLTVADLLYDGDSLSFILDREGVDLPNTASPYISEDAEIISSPEYIKSRQVPEKDQKKGYIKTPTILANGQKVDFSEGMFGDYPMKDNAYSVKLTKGLNLPDQFELTIQANVTGVEGTFEFKIPVNIDNKALEKTVQAAVKQGIVSEPNLSVTHDGITLTVADLLYDGDSLSFILDREGIDLPNTASPYISEDAEIISSPEYIKSRQVPEKDQKKGYIKTPTILANGQKVDFSEGMFGDYPEKDNAYSVKLTKGLNLPDQFELTIQANVTGVKGTFEFKIPVKSH